MPVTARFLYIPTPSAKMYSGESQNKRKVSDNGKEKQENVSLGSEFDCGICAMDGVSPLR
jgi:hypothetical protein